MNYLHRYLSSRSHCVCCILDREWSSVTLPPVYLHYTCEQCTYTHKRTHRGRHMLILFLRQCVLPAVNLCNVHHGRNRRQESLSKNVQTTLCFAVSTSYLNPHHQLIHPLILPTPVLFNHLYTGPCGTQSVRCHRRWETTCSNSPECLLLPESTRAVFS